MQIRETLNERPGLALAVLGPIIAISIVFTIWWLWPRTEPVKTPRAYFYDQNTGETFILPAAETGPVERESGPYNGLPAGVRAHYFCCGQYKKGTEKWLGYLEIPTEALPRDQWPDGFDPEEETEGDDMMLRRVDDKKWVGLNSQEGIAILLEVKNKCPEGQRYRPVVPLPK
jgi:hypothetical protein